MLSHKVAPATGEFRPFHGDTIAYFLDQPTRDMVHHVTDLLIERHGPSLSARLHTDQAHVTLHDLHADVDPERVRALVHARPQRAAELVAQARRLGPIHMLGTRVFNLVNTSIVIGLRPAEDQAHEALLAARALFDEFVPSGPFTPHITLAYYRPQPPVALVPAELRATLSELTRLVQGVPVVLHPGRLHHLHFGSMNSYRLSG